jgi:hypothetical protein
MTLQSHRPHLLFLPCFHATFSESYRASVSAAGEPLLRRTPQSTKHVAWCMHSIVVPTSYLLYSDFARRWQIHSLASSLFCTSVVSQSVGECSISACIPCYTMGTVMTLLIYSHYTALSSKWHMDLYLYPGLSQYGWLLLFATCLYCNEQRELCAFHEHDYRPVKMAVLIIHSILKQSSISTSVCNEHGLLMNGRSANSGAA